MTPTYKIFAVVINPKTSKVERKPVLAVKYEHAQAIEAVALLMAHRDQNAKFGTFTNPLRYEAASPVGIAEAF